MKIIEVKKKYHFNQNTFYKWLRDEEMIVHSDSGYITGPKALTGMKTMIYQIKLGNNEKTDCSQVIIDDSQVYLLVEMYTQSELSNLYTRKYHVNLLKEELAEAQHTIKILEGQISFLTSLLKS